MAKFGEGGELLKCSFCGKSQKQVRKLIAGPGVYICDECIDLCNEIIEEEFAGTEELDFTELPKPQEILAFLDDYAYLAWGLTELYESTFDPRWLGEAKRLLAEMVERFLPDLPNFPRLIAGGSWGPMLSTIPCDTPTA